MQIYAHNARKYVWRLRPDQLGEPKHSPRSLAAMGAYFYREREEEKRKGEGNKKGDVEGKGMGGTRSTVPADP